MDTRAITKPTKAELLAQLAQWDERQPMGWLLYAIDDYKGELRWTAEGDEINYELINPGDTVKVFVKPEASASRVAMALCEIADLLLERQRQGH